MIRLESITLDDVDRDWLTPYARMELEQNLTAGEDLYVLRAPDPILVVGIRRWSLVRAPELWILLCRDFRPIFVRWSKKAVKDLLVKYHKLQVWVRTDYPAGRRFALAHGFVGERVMTLDGVEYEEMIARNS